MQHALIQAWYMDNITVGYQLIANYGTMPAMRNAWMNAEELGVDRLYTSDQMNAIPINTDLVSQSNDGTKHTVVKGNIFE